MIHGLQPFLGEAADVDEGEPESVIIAILCYRSFDILGVDIPVAARLKIGKAGLCYLRESLPTSPAARTWPRAAPGE